MGFPRQDLVLHHSSEDAREHARGGVADIARSRSWYVCLAYETLREYKLEVRDSRRRLREYYPRYATGRHRRRLMSDLVEAFVC